MKKISLFASVALFFSTACLTLLPQKESAPQANPSATNRRINESASATPRAMFTPQRRATPTSTTAAPTPRWTFTAPSPADRSIYADDLAAEYHPILDKLPYASLYAIEFVIAEDLTRVAGRATITYFNAEDVELQEVALRLFSNILAGEMQVENVTVDRREAKTSRALEDSLLIVKLDEALPPRASVVIAMDFEIRVAQTLGSHYSVQTYYDGVLTLAHAYPMIAVYDDKGWNAEIPPQHGDLTYADMAFYVVTVEAPAQLTLVASGRELNREESASRQRVVYAAGPARDFFLAASSDFSVFTKEADGVALRFYARKSRQSGAESALDVAARALEIFGERCGAYPYLELDFVSTPTTAGGVEYPGAIAIAGEYIAPNNIYLEAITAHEVGHQWFYNLVGNDQLDEPWLDESLTQFITLQYFETTGGASQFRGDLTRRWRSISEDLPVGLPVRDYSAGEYGAVVYGRGALFFEALRLEMGVENFDAFLREYAQANAWDVASTEKLKAAAEARCACDLTPLFQNWIYP